MLTEPCVIWFQSTAPVQPSQMHLSVCLMLPSPCSPLCPVSLQLYLSLPHFPSLLPTPILHLDEAPDPRTTYVLIQQLLKE